MTLDDTPRPYLGTPIRSRTHDTAHEAADACAALLAHDPARAEEISDARVDILLGAGGVKPTGGVPAGLLYGLRHGHPGAAVWFTVTRRTVIAVMARRAPLDPESETRVWNGVRRAVHGVSNSPEGTTTPHFALPPEIALLRWEDPKGKAVYATGPRPARSFKPPKPRSGGYALGLPAGLPLLLFDLGRRTSTTGVAAALALTVTITAWEHAVVVDLPAAALPGQSSAPSAPLPSILPPTTPPKTPAPAAGALTKAPAVKLPEPPTGTLPVPEVDLPPAPVDTPTPPVEETPGTDVTPTPGMSPLKDGTPDATPTPAPPADQRTPTPSPTAEPTRYRADRNTRGRTPRTRPRSGHRHT